MTDPGTATFPEMARAHPMRTGLFTLVPLLFVLSQLVLSYAMDGSLVITTVFSVAVLVYAVLVNQYHLAAFERAKHSPFGANPPRV